MALLPCSAWCSPSSVRWKTWSSSPSPGRSSLEELEAQCQSDFERQVLRAIHERGLPLPDAAQKTLYDGDEPIAIADFYYEPNIVVFVDGSPHFRDYVAAADDAKRRRLKAKGYRVVAIRAGDVEGGLDDLEARIKRQSRKRGKS